MSTDPDDVSARAAVHAVRRGDRDAFSTLVVRYQRRLFALALMVTRDRVGAEDVAQDAFVRAFVHLESYDIRRPFYPWLARIAVRLSQNWLVQRGRTASRVGDSPDERALTATQDQDPLTDLIADEEDRELWRAVSGLPSGERTAVLLHYRQGMRVAEIAAALGVTTGTVKTQLFRARATLRTALQPADGPMKVG